MEVQIKREISQIVKYSVEDFGLHLLGSGMPWKTFKQGNHMIVYVFSIGN